MPQCRLCWEEDGDFVSPCDCKGTSAFIHEDCVLKEVQSCHSFQCSVCKGVYPYRFMIPKDIQYKCKQIVSCLSLEAVFIFLMKIYPHNVYIQYSVLTLYVGVLLLLFYLSR